MVDEAHGGGSEEDEDGKKEDEDDGHATTTTLVGVREGGKSDGLGRDATMCSEGGNARTSRRRRRTALCIYNSGITPTMSKPLKLPADRD